MLNSKELARLRKKDVERSRAEVEEWFASYTRNSLVVLAFLLFVGGIAEWKYFHQLAIAIVLGIVSFLLAFVVISADDGGLGE